MKVSAYTAASFICPACGATGSMLTSQADGSVHQVPAAKTRYCQQECERDALGHFDASPSALGAVPTPHLHRTCANCGYERLETTASPVAEC